MFGQKVLRLMAINCAEAETRGDQDGTQQRHDTLVHMQCNWLSAMLCDTFPTHKTKSRQRDRVSLLEGCGFLLPPQQLDALRHANVGEVELEQRCGCEDSDTRQHHQCHALCSRVVHVVHQNLTKQTRGVNTSLLREEQRTPADGPSECRCGRAGAGRQTCRCR